MFGITLRTKLIIAAKILGFLALNIALVALSACKQSSGVGGGDSPSTQAVAQPGPTTAVQEPPKSSTPPETSNPQPTLAIDGKEYLCGSTQNYVYNTPAEPFKIWFINRLGAPQYLQDLATLGNLSAFPNQAPGTLPSFWVFNTTATVVLTSGEVNCAFSVYGDLRVDSVIQ